MTDKTAVALQVNACKGSGSFHEVLKNSSGKDPGKRVCVRVREDMFFACGLCVCVWGGGGA